VAEPMKVWRYVLEDGTRRRWLVGEPPPAGSFPIGDAVEAEEVEVIPVSDAEVLRAERDAQAGVGEQHRESRDMARSEAERLREQRDQLQAKWDQASALFERFVSTLPPQTRREVEAAAALEAADKETGP
jgi:hypothetical protein